MAANNDTDWERNWKTDNTLCIWSDVQDAKRASWRPSNERQRVIFALIFPNQASVTSTWWVCVRISVRVSELRGSHMRFGGMKGDPPKQKAAKERERAADLFTHTHAVHTEEAMSFGEWERKMLPEWFNKLSLVRDWELEWEGTKKEESINIRETRCKWESSEFFKCETASAASERDGNAGENPLHRRTAASREKKFINFTSTSSHEEGY